MYSYLKSMVGLSDDSADSEKAQPAPQVQQPEGNEAAASNLGRFVHTVQRGETFGTICASHDKPASCWEELWEVNKDQVPDPDRLEEGVSLVLPTSWVERAEAPAAPASPTLDRAAEQVEGQEGGSDWSPWDVVEQGAGAVGELAGSASETAGVWLDSGIASLDGLVRSGGSLLSGGADAQREGKRDPTATEAIGQAQAASALANAMAASAAAARATGSDVYFSQMDNKTDTTTEGGARVKDSNMCTVTSLAMQISTMAGGESAGRAAVVRLLEETHGQSVGEPRRSEAQVEDLLWDRFALWGSKEWNHEVDQSYDFSPSDYQTLINMKDWKLGKFHQFAICQQIVLDEVAEYVDAMGEVTMVLSDLSADSDAFKAQLEALVDEGGTARLGTKLTGGHIVMLKEVLDEGIVIYDPYGCGLEPGRYLINGNDGPSLRTRFSNDRDLLEKRWSRHPERLAELDEAQAGDTMEQLGKGVFYTWDEVRDYQIGTSAVSVASSRSGKARS